MKIIFAVIVAIVLMAIGLGIFVTMTDDAGNCLDMGGCWDYVDKVCRKEEPNAQALCDRK